MSEEQDALQEIMAAQKAAGIPQETPASGRWDDFVMPVAGEAAGGFADSRAGGGRQHMGGDLMAPAGTPVVAPKNMKFLSGGQGGTNLRKDDYWAHFQGDDGLEYRFAHIGDVSGLKPGQVVQQGDPWSVVGKAIDSPHVHLSVYDPGAKSHVDWMGGAGVKRGQKVGWEEAMARREIEAAMALSDIQAAMKGSGAPEARHSKATAEPFDATSETLAQFVNPPTDDFTKPLQDNRRLDFVDRILRPEKYPSIKNEDGSYSSHLMSSADNIVFPEIVRKPNEDALTRLSPQEARDYALKSGEFIEFGTPEEADQFASGGYKTAANQLRKQTSTAPAGAYSLGPPQASRPGTKSVMMSDETYDKLSRKYPIFREEKISAAPEALRPAPPPQRTESIWKDTSKTLGEHLLSTASAEIPPEPEEDLKGELHRPARQPTISARKATTFELVNKNIAAVNRPILESLVGYAGIVENALAIPYRTISGDKRPIARPLTWLAKEMKEQGAPEILKPEEGEEWATMPGQVVGGLAAYMLPGKFVPKGGGSLFEHYLHNLGTFLPADVARGFAEGGEEGAKRGLYNAVPTAAAFTVAQILPTRGLQTLGVGTAFAGSAYAGGERDPYKLTADFLTGVGLHWLGTRGLARQERVEKLINEWKEEFGVNEKEFQQVKEILGSPVPEKWQKEMETFATEGPQAGTPAPPEWGEWGTRAKKSGEPVIYQSQTTAEAQAKYINRPPKVKAPGEGKAGLQEARAVETEDGWTLQVRERAAPPEREVKPPEPVFEGEPGEWQELEIVERQRGFITREIDRQNRIIERLDEKIASLKTDKGKEKWGLKRQAALDELELLERLKREDPPSPQPSPTRGEGVEGRQAGTPAPLEAGEPKLTVPLEPWQRPKEDFARVTLDNQAPNRPFRLVDPVTGEPLRMPERVGPGEKPTAPVYRFEKPEQARKVMDLEHRKTVKRALEEGKYREALEAGKMDYAEVRGVIESAGVKVPRGLDAFEFIKTPDGEMRMGEIGPAAASQLRREPGEIRLQKGEHREGSRFGLDHVEKSHGEQIRQAGYDKPEDFIREVAADYDEIRQGTGGALLLVKRNGQNKLAVVELRPGKEAGFYTVKSGWLPPERYLKNKELLWDRRAPDQATPGTDSPLYPSSQELPGREGRGTQGQSSLADEKITAEGEDVKPDPIISPDGEIKWMYSGGPDTAEVVRGLESRGWEFMAHHKIMPWGDFLKGRMAQTVPREFMRQGFKDWLSWGYFPAWVGDKWTAFKRFYQANIKADDVMSNHRYEIYGKLKPYFRELAGAERRRVHDVALAMDRIKSAERRRSIEDEIQAQGPAYFQDKHGLSSREAEAAHGLWDAYRYVRVETIKGMKQDVVDLGMKYGLDEARAREFAEDVLDKDLRGDYFPLHYSIMEFLPGKEGMLYDTIKRQRENYDFWSRERALYMFPHTRWGPYWLHVYAKDNPTPLWAGAAESIGEYKKMAAKIKKEFAGQEVEFKESRKDKVPMELYNNVDMPGLAAIMELSRDQFEAEAWTKFMEAKQAFFAQKGWGAHKIHKSDIPGFETENDKRVISDYFEGWIGMEGKSHRVRGFTEAWTGFKELKGGDDPGLQKYTQGYVKYLLDHPREAGWIRRYLYHLYLGGSMGFRLLHGLHAVQTAWPEMSTISKQPGRVLSRAIKDRFQLTAFEQGWSKDPGFTAEELTALEAGRRKAALSTDYTAEMAARSNSPLYRALNDEPQGLAAKLKRGFDLIYYPTAADRFTREAIFLGAVRELRGKGDITPEVIDRAAEIVDNSMYRYARGERPPFGRKGGAVWMTFQTWSAKYFQQIFRYMRDGEGKALGRLLAAAGMVGGLNALGLRDVIQAAYRNVYGRDAESDGKHYLQTVLGDRGGEALNRIMFRGLPAGLMGFDLSPRMAHHLPWTFLAKGVKGLLGDKEAAWQFAGAALGPVDSVGRSLRAVHENQYGRALEAVAPTWLRNPMAAHRLYTRGPETVSGRPIVGPDFKQHKMSLGEAALKASGVQPVRLSEEQGKFGTSKMLDEAAQGKLRDWASRAVQAKRANDKEGLQAVRREWNDYNRRMQAAGRRADIITVKQFRAAVQIRERPVFPDKTARKTKLRQNY